MTTQGEMHTLCVPDEAAWRDWLIVHGDTSDGVWLVLAKKGTELPTSLSYQLALEEALCSGWIDGQRRSYDDTTFLQRFTPRRARSIWSQRNVNLIAELRHSGRLRAGGEREVARAQADGRWDRAYAGPAQAVAPDGLRAALARHPRAEAAFAALSSTARYSALHPILTAARPETQERRIAALIARLDVPDTDSGPVHTTGREADATG